MKFADTGLAIYVRHNPGQVISLVLALTLTGCALFPFKATSPTDGRTAVTRDQLNAEITAFQARQKADLEIFISKANAADATLARKELIATAGFQALTQLAGNPGVAVPTVLAGALTLLTGGLAFDNRRKDTKLLIEKEAKGGTGGNPS